MARNRRINREKIKSQGMLDSRNEYGHHDPTPYHAVKRILKKQMQQARQ